MSTQYSLLYRLGFYINSVNSTLVTDVAGDQTASSTAVSRQELPVQVLVSPDQPTATPPHRRHKSDTASDIISPPTPFKMERLPLRPESSSTASLEDKKPISRDLKKEIEMSLLHWPATAAAQTSTADGDTSSRPLHLNPSQRSLTIPNDGQTRLPKS